MFENVGRRKVEKAILTKLEQEYCNPYFFNNIRIIDIINQIEEIAIKMYTTKEKVANNDVLYCKVIVPLVEMILNDLHTVKITDNGDIRLYIPLKQEDIRGDKHVQHEIQFNVIQGGIEKVDIFDYRRYGLKRLFRSERCVYDRYGIETQREIEILKRDEKSVKTMYIYSNRLEGNPNIIEQIQNSRPLKKNGIVRYYDIKDSFGIENLDINKKNKIQETDIKQLTQEEKNRMLERIKPIYRKGIERLMKVSPEQDDAR